MVFFDPQEGCQDGIPLYVSNAKGFMLFNGWRFLIKKEATILFLKCC
jgi:hypothetical protein